MKKLSLKQIRNAALCLVAASLPVYGAHSLRTVAQPTAPHTVNVRVLLADDGQETHGGKGHRSHGSKGHRADVSHLA